MVHRFARALTLPLCLFALSCGAGSPTLEATLTYTARMDDGGAGGDLLCNLELSLSGTSWEGECADCMWAFELASTVALDTSTEECLARTAYSLYPRGDVPLILAGYEVYVQPYTYYSPDQEGDYYSYGETRYRDIPDALVAFYTETERLKFLLAPSDDGVTRFSKESVEWELETNGSSTFFEEPWGSSCQTLATAAELVGAVDGQVHEATYDCGGPDVADVWTVEGRVGEDWEFEVELANPDDGFAISQLFISDALGCWIVDEWQSSLADCTYDSHLCSGNAVHLSSDGPVTVLVSYGCADSDPDVPYHLLVRGPDGPAEATFVAAKATYERTQNLDVAQSVTLSGVIGGR